jgi:hypothetical protein
MLSPTEILDASRRRWNDALRAEARGEVVFPLRIRVGRPSTTRDFLSLRAEIEALADARYPWSVEWELVETRKWGKQRWPVKLTYDSVERLAEAIGRSHELVRFRKALEFARAHCPALEPWLQSRGHTIVKYLDDWSDLVAVCVYFDKNPRPHCFARQVPVGHSKFIESRTGILREMLDATLGDRVTDMEGEFSARFGLLVDPPLVRFRFLDPALQAKVGWPVASSAVPLPLMTNLAWNIPRVIVVENRDVFLSLPPIPLTLAIFGSGKAASILSDLGWLHEADIVYWGDCDEAGFGVLASLRAQLPKVRSALMDDVTWERWVRFVVPGKRDRTARHDGLTEAERRALEWAVAGPWLLEQERIPVAEANEALVGALLGER